MGMDGDKINVPYPAHRRGTYMSNEQLQPPVPERQGGRDVPEPTIDRDDIFEILSNERRRYILHYLRQQEDGYVADLREVVDQVAAWENETSIEDVSSDNRKCVYTAIRQSHLPKLSDAGVIEYDKQRGKITLTDVADDLNPYLGYPSDDEISWGGYYLALSSVCLAVAGASYLDVLLFGEIPALMIAGLIVVLMIVSSAIHVYVSQQDRVGSKGPPGK